LYDARRKYDVVYVLGYGASVFFVIPRLFGTPVWVNMDGIEWLRSKWGMVAKAYLRVMERIAINFANHIIADAHSIKRYLSARYHRMPPCDVIAYGAPVHEEPADPSALQSLGLDPRSYYLVVCRIEPENHVSEIIDGFLRAGSQRSLIVVGDILANTPYLRSLKTIKSDLVRFIGAVYDPGLLRALRQYSFAYFHGHSVGGTNPSLLEALGSSNIVIAHDNEFNREVCGDLAVYFASSSDIPALVRTVESYNDQRRSHIAAQCRNRILSHYSWPKIVDNYAKLIDRCTRQN
jgi:glycosyltransferase involved in cell wall biosynthesis